MQVNLILGSGGARGFAHLGVIEELRERGHEVVGVAGTSMGALVAGVLAAGTIDEFSAYVRTLTRADYMRLTDLTLGAPGLVRLQRVIKELHRFVGDVRIEDLPIPYTAVATDIDQVREVWFRSGPLIAAIRASIAIPAVFTPVRIDERLLVDGGLLNPLPMAAAMEMPGSVSVAVSLFARPPGLHNGGSPSHESSDAASADNGDIAADAKQPSWGARIGETLSDSWAGRRIHELLSPPEPDKPYEDLPSDVNIMDLLGRTLDVMQARIEVARTVLEPPDVLIGVPVDTCSVLDFQRCAELIDLGRTLAAAEFDRIGL